MHTEIENGEQLSGKLSITFKANNRFIEFCEKHFTNFNSEQYEPIAIRMFYGQEIVITLYALDRIRREGTSNNPEKVPVKKFKSGAINLNDVFTYIQEFNFTVGAGNYDLDEMEVINK